MNSNAIKNETCSAAICLLRLIANFHYFNERLLIILKQLRFVLLLVTCHKAWHSGPNQTLTNAHITIYCQNSGSHTLECNVHVPNVRHLLYFNQWNVFNEEPHNFGVRYWLYMLDVVIDCLTINFIIYAGLIMWIYGRLI